MVELSDQFGKPYFTKGGQGKLFHDPKPIDEHRYQRGYSPERMAEVKSWPLEITTTTKQKEATSHQGVVHATREILARSTTPSSDFDNMRPDGVRPRTSKLAIQTGRKMPRGIGGQYHDFGTGPLAGNRGQIKTGDMAVSPKSVDRMPKSRNGLARQNERFGRTLLHELGHFTSKMTGRSSSRYHTPEEVGTEEAFADDNAVRRFRPDPRDVRAGRSTAATEVSAYEGSRGFAKLGGVNKHRAQAAYKASRETPLRGPIQRQAESLEAQRREAGHRLVNDQLFHRDYSAEEETGKPAWQTNPKHMPNG